MNDLKNYKQLATPFWVENGYGTRFQKFQNLMRFRIRDILIVSSLYDLYIFEEDGRLYELIRSEYQGLNLSHTPELTHVSSGEEAIKMIREEKRFDLIITTLHIDDMLPVALAKKIRQLGLVIPIIMLAFDNRELADMLARNEDRLFDQIFIWHGNFRLLLAMIKHLEDVKNVEHDTHIMGVQSIIIIEDNIRDYSAFLPTIYIEILRQSQRLIRDGISLAHKNLRQRTRPKILLCKTYEMAWRYFDTYHDTVLGIISDIDFPHHGENDRKAGIKFAKAVRKIHPDIPILLHSSRSSHKSEAQSIGCEFLHKNSPTLLHELQEFMSQYFGFGDFIFKTKTGTEVGRAHNLSSLEKQLKIIPDESLEYHSERNHFSNWLKARTEFQLAFQLRPRKISDFPSISGLRNHLISSLRDYRKGLQRGIITDFDKHSFDPTSSISRIGEGSLGGKARGLSFFNTLINSYHVQHKFEGVELFIPSALVITTDIFDHFLSENNLKDFALNSTNDKKILEQFVSADKFPESTILDLKAFLELVDTPLAVRSSSLLEDSHNHPFAGVYGTLMLPNSHPDIDIRVSELLKAIKLVYATTFLKSAKDYIKATSFRLEEEKMAIVIQILIGKKYKHRYYPTFSGTARAYNFYPIPPQQSSDGIVSVALGLGKMVVEGGMCVRFSPKYPQKTIQFSSPKLALQNNQHEFYALDLNKSMMSDKDIYRIDDISLKKYPLRCAEHDGSLAYVGSTYSPQNDVIYDDTVSEGVRVVSFAPIIKHDLMPLANILQLLLELGSWGMGTPVEIEFAANMDIPEGQPKQFCVLQIRPMILHREVEVLTIHETDNQKMICRSNQVMGNGLIENIFDIVLVDRDKYDRSKSREVALEVSRLNAKLISENRSYILIGVGRWGSQDQWLGIPVTWDQISGASAIVETSFKDLMVSPSQGSHFFENLNSFHVGYFTVQTNQKGCFVDWDWLLNQQAIEEKKFTKLLRFEQRVITKMDGRTNRGVILKPVK